MYIFKENILIESTPENLKPILVFLKKRNKVV